MKRTIFISILVFVATLVAGSLASTQNLGDISRQEREKQEKDKEKSQKPAKAYTNADLAKLTGGHVSSVSPQTEPAEGDLASAQDAGEKSESAAAAGETKEEAKGEAYWRKRAADARGSAAKTQERLDFLMKDRQRLFKQYSNENSSAQKAAYKLELDVADAKIEQARTDAKNAAQAVTDLDIEAKSAGAKLEWLREQ